MSRSIWRCVRGIGVVQMVSADLRLPARVSVPEIACLRL